MWESYAGPLAVLVVMDHRSSAWESYTGPRLSGSFTEWSWTTAGPVQGKVLLVRCQLVFMDHQSSARESFTGPLAVLVVVGHRTSSMESFTGPLAVSVVALDHWANGNF